MPTLKMGLAAAAFAIAGLLTSAITASAQGACQSWETGKVEREEGKEWTASICASGKGRDATLEIVCFGPSLNVRYLPVIPDSMNPGDAARPFEFSASSGRRQVSLGYEAMDGAFAAVVARGNPLFELLMSGDRLAIRDTKGKVPTQTYTLKGARAAIRKLMANCRK